MRWSGILRLVEVGTSKTHTQEELKRRTERRRYSIVAVLLHMIFLLFLALPWLNFPVPPPGQQGILVTFGEPEALAIGQADDSEQASEAEAESGGMDEARQESESSEEPGQQVEELVDTRNTSNERKLETPVLEDPESELRLAETRQKEKDEAIERAAQKAREEEARRKSEAKARAEAQARAEQERLVREAEERKRKLEEAKNKYGSMFEPSAGAEANERKGSSGSRNGESEAKAMEGLTTGAGRVGDGLGNRGVMYHPRIEDRSQKTGTVVVYICVDNNGSVESARFTQKGSSTTDQHLVDLAVQTARKYKFTISETLTQCGTITFEFRLR